MITMPYATAVTLLYQLGIPGEDAEKAAEIIDSFPPRRVTNGNDEYLQVIEDFAMLYPLDRKQAFAFLQACAGQ